MTMKTFTASGGTVFRYDPALEGEIWITADKSTVTLAVEDLLEFSAEAAGVPPRGTEAEVDLLMGILESCGIFDGKQSREVSRARLASHLGWRR